MNSGPSASSSWRNSSSSGPSSGFFNSSASSSSSSSSSSSGWLSSSSSSSSSSSLSDPWSSSSSSSNVSDLWLSSTSSSSSAAGLQVLVATQSDVIPLYVKLIFGIVLGVTSLIAIPLLYFFYQRRNVQPIKARLPMLVIGAAVSIWSWVHYEAFHIIFVTDFPCWLHTLCSHLFIFAGFDMYFLRIWVLFFAYNLTQEKLRSAPRSFTPSTSKTPDKSHDITGTPTHTPGMIPLKTITRSHSHSSVHQIQHISKPQHDNHTHEKLPHDDDMEMEDIHLSHPGHTWYLSRKHLVSREYLMVYFFIALTIQALTPVILIGLSDVLQTEAVIHCLSSSASDYFLFGYLIVYCVLFVYSAYRLRLVDDGFHIKRELKFTSIMVGIATIVWFILSVTPNTAESDITPFPITSLFLIVIAVSVLWYSFSFPLYHSYVQMNITEQQMHEKYSIQSINSLEKLLNHKVGAASFKAFMIKEFAIENFMFYRATQDFEKKYEEQDKQMLETQQLPPPPQPPILEKHPSTSTPNPNPRELYATTTHSSASSIKIQHDDHTLLCGAPQALTPTNNDFIAPIHVPPTRTLTHHDSMIVQRVTADVPSPSSTKSRSIIFPVSANTTTQSSYQLGLPPKHNNTKPKREGVVMIKVPHYIRYKHAKQIFDDFISPESKMQVNLPSNIVHEIWSLLNVNTFQQHTSLTRMSQEFNRGSSSSTVTPSQVLGLMGASASNIATQPPTPTGEPPFIPTTIFKSAQDSIFKLMLNDSYKRFLMSDQYKELIEELERKENETVILQDIHIL